MDEDLSRLLDEKENESTNDSDNDVKHDLEFMLHLMKSQKAFDDARRSRRKSMIITTIISVGFFGSCLLYRLVTMFFPE